MHIQVQDNTVELDSSLRTSAGLEKRERDKQRKREREIEDRGEERERERKRRGVESARTSERKFYMSHVTFFRFGGP